MTTPEQIVAALERMSYLLRQVEWDLAYPDRLTPLQRQILWYLYAYPDRARATHLSRYLGVKKPTISIALALLERKGYVRRETDPRDRRSHRLRLTEKAQTLMPRLSLEKLVKAVSTLPEADQQRIREGLYLLLEGLVERGVIQEAYLCATCGHFDRGRGYCNLLQKPLPLAERRLLCREHSLLASKG